MSEHEINPLIWFGERELTYTPKHFVSTNTPLTTESKLWIISKLSGRFSYINQINESSDYIMLSDSTYFPAFEDPAEAVLYELYWS
jgi:hypothetical protein